jgi:hypothetical protein
MKKAEVKPDEELADAVETLEQITDEWFEQQSFRFEKPKPTSHIKRFSDRSILILFKNTMCKKRRLSDIFKIFCLYTLKIVRSLKEIGKYIIVRLIEFILKVERH